jgi:hypothetical protein
MRHRLSDEIVIGVEGTVLTAFKNMRTISLVA